MLDHDSKVMFTRMGMDQVFMDLYRIGFSVVFLLFSVFFLFFLFGWLVGWWVFFGGGGGGYVLRYCGQIFHCIAKFTRSPTHVFALERLLKQIILYCRVG